MGVGIHDGHRSRMKRKFADFGARVFDTYELLEMLLYNTVPVKDTNPIAKRLLSRFGTLDGVLSAGKEELVTVEGVGDKTADLIIAVGEMLTEIINSDGKFGEAYDDYYELGAMVTELFTEKDGYRVLLLSFDNDMRLLGVDEICQCDYSSGAVRAKAFLDVVIKRGASVAVVAHNHPYGPLYPTEGDNETNRMVKIALFDVGVFLVEHYIVCGDKFVGFMEHIADAFRQKPAISKFHESKRGIRNE